MDFEYYWEEFKFWIEDRDNWLRLGGLISVLIVLVLGGLMIREEALEGVPQGAEETALWLIEKTDPLKENFSLLDQQSLTFGETKYISYDIDLYMKNPFLNSSDIRRLLTDYVEALKMLEKQNKRGIRAVRFTLYDRKVLYDLGLAHRGIYTYRIQNSSIKKEDVIGNESLEDAGWRITTSNTKKPKYEDYRVESSNVRDFQVSPSSNPLSDQEFEWYLKYSKYALFKDPTSLYLEWELGAPRDKAVDNRFNINKQFQDFAKRLTGVGDLIQFWDYPDGVKRQLIITHPQFLYYATTGQVAKNDIDARSKLLKSNPDFYTDTISEWLDSLSAEQVNQLTQEAQNSNDMNSLDTLINTELIPTETLPEIPEDTTVEEAVIKG